jgi:uncharacterized protein
MSDNGKFRLYYRKGWAWLEVTPPGEGGRPVYPEEIENRMRLLQIPRVSNREIRRRIQDADGVSQKLVEWPEGERLASRVTVEIAGDAMSAAVVVDAPRKGALPPRVEDLEEELSRSGVLFGTDRRALRRLLDEQAYGVSRIVARGRVPVFGSSRSIRYHFNTNRGRPWLEMEFERINLKELNFIANCKAGDLLAELLPPVEPVDGMTVTGTVIPAERDETSVQLKAGKNTSLNDDRTRLVATVDGNVKQMKDEVMVEPLIVVSAVNYETGNIRFDGSVVIEGSVADGFVVEAGGDIEVGKGVGRATLKAGGTILLKTGINGNDESFVECGGNLLARYIESSTVTCRGNVLVEEAIMHSRITVWNHCVLSGRRAEFIGGELLAGGSLWCRKLGNFNEAATRIALGVSPNRMLSYRSAQQNLETSRRELDRTEEQLDQCEKALRDGHQGEKILLARDQLRSVAERLSLEIVALQKETRSLRDQLEASRKSILVAEDEIFPGVTVVFGMREYRSPERGARRTILRVGAEGIAESGFDPGNRPVLNFEEPSGAV